MNKRDDRNTLGNPSRIPDLALALALVLVLLVLVLVLVLVLALVLASCTFLRPEP